MAGTGTRLRRFGKITGGGGLVTPPAGAKAAMTGLVAEYPGGWNATRAGDLGGLWTKLYWSELQPTANGPIDTASASWVRLQAAVATGLPVRARIFAGRHAPAWVMTLGGGPLQTFDPYDGTALSDTPRWWTPDVLSSGADFMAKTAALVEPLPTVVDVAWHIATTTYAESCIRGTAKTLASDGLTNVERYLAAGLGEAVFVGGTATGPAPLDAAALTFPFDLVGGVSRWQSWGFASTRLYVAHNPLQSWKTSAASRGYDQLTNPGGFTGKMITAERANLGARAVVANNSVRVPFSALGSAYAAVYQQLGASGAAVGYQCATVARMLASYQTVKPTATSSQALAATLDTVTGIVTSANDPLGLLPTGVTRMRARSVEVPANWDTLLTSAQCSVYNLMCAGAPTGD